MKGKAAVGLFAAITYSLLLAESASAVQIDLNGIYTHPVQMAVGISALVLSLILLIYAIAAPILRRSKRKRSYGAQQKPEQESAYRGGNGGNRDGTVTTSLPGSYKEPWRKKKQYGGVPFGLALPFYRGGASKAGEARVAGPHSPKRYKQFSGQKGKSVIGGGLARSYKGGFSAAESANLQGALPLSYKESKGSGKQYRRFQFGIALPFYHGGSKAGEAVVPGNHSPKRYQQFSGQKAGIVPGNAAARSYKGGFAGAGSANLQTSLPLSYKESKGSGKRYGIFRFGIALPFYHGGSKAGEAVVPGNHSPKRYQQFSGQKAGIVPGNAAAQSYKGGFAGAGSANLQTSLPLSYKESKGSEKRYGIFRFGIALPFYHGGSKAGEAVVPGNHSPKRYQQFSGQRARIVPGGAAAQSYKGGFTAADNGGALNVHLPSSYGGRILDTVAGSVPVIQHPSSHKRRISGVAGGNLVQLPVRSYHGGYAKAGSADLSTVRPSSHGGRRILGVRSAGNMTVLLPTSHTQKSRGVYGAEPIEGRARSYKGGKTAAGVGNPVELLPQSYKQSWGTQRRYGGKLSMVSPTERYKGGAAAKNANPTELLPQSYREPPIGRKRYGTGLPKAYLPSYKGGFTPAKNGNPTEELPLSYKESWGKAERFGHQMERLIPQVKHYQGGSTTNPDEIWYHPDTGVPAPIPNVSGAKRFGNKRYGGKLYGQRTFNPKRYEKKENEQPLEL